MPRTKSNKKSKLEESLDIISEMESRSDRKGRKNKETDAATNSGQGFIPTGSTLLNLALSDKWNGGWPTGKISNLIGDSSSGKTFLAMTAFAEMRVYKRYDDYRLIFDDVEAANEFDMTKLFGLGTAERIEAPRPTEIPENSDSIQDFELNMANVIEAETPFLYILDSFDALTSEEEVKRTEDRVEAARNGKTVETGSYGMEKAKKSGQILRQIKGKLSHTASSLIIISQTRDNIGIGFAKKTRSGGKALKFYSTHEIWTAVAGTIKRKNMPVGVLCRIKVSKNKITGKVREVTIPIYYDYGIDDVESCIDWLVANKHWPIKGRTINACKDFDDLQCTKEKMIRIIEEEGLERELSKVVGEYWTTFENSIRTDRKRKYE